MNYESAMALQNTNVSAIMSRVSAFASTTTNGLIQAFSAPFSGTSSVTQRATSSIGARSPASVTEKSANTDIVGSLKNVNETYGKLVDINNSLNDISESSKKVTDAFQSVSDSSKGIKGDIFQSLSVGISILGPGLEIANAGMAIFSALSTVVSGPIGLIIIGVTALVAALAYFFTQTQTGQAIVQSVWTAISGFISTSVETIKMIWNNLQLFFQGLWTTITTLFSTSWAQIMTILTTIWQGIILAAQTVWTTLVTVISTIISTIVTFITTTFSSLVTGVQTIFNGLVVIVQGIWEMLKNIVLGSVLLLVNLVTGNFTELKTNAIAIWNNLVAAASMIWTGLMTLISGLVQTILGIVSGIWNTLSAVTSTIFHAILGIISAVWGTITTIITTVVSSISSIISNGFNLVKSTVSTIFNGVKTTISNVMNSASNLVSGAIEKIKAFFTSLGSVDLFAIGTNIIQGLVNGIGSMASSVWEKVQSIADAIPNGIKKLLGIHSPSRVLFEIGKYTGQGLVNGLFSQESAVEKQAQAYADILAEDQYVGNPSIGLALNNVAQGAKAQSLLTNLTNDVFDTLQEQPVFEIHNEIVGDKIVTLVNSKNIRNQQKINLIHQV